MHALGTSRGPSGGHGARRDKRDEMEGPPPLSSAALVTLVGLLRQSHPLHKGHLQKLFLNLCSRSEIRSTILQLLLRMLTESSKGAADPQDLQPAFPGNALNSNVQIEVRDAKIQNLAPIHAFYVCADIKNNYKNKKTLMVLVLFPFYVALLSGA